ncbi:MAG TPA: ribonuclease H-like domain-containing protein [Thermomicrobiales bacterium]|nr:ribonuclease H-like domain-containing protein [Thermomicrobiales bacterium]
MSERSFRQRFGALERSVEPPSRSRPADEEWPLPAGARLLDTEAGPCVVIERVVGGEPVSAAFDRFAMAAVDDGRYQQPERLVFLDTETTGLSGGTGSYVFLVGIGRFIGRSFLLRQFFMRHPGDERPVLSGLAESLQDVGGLVTYNGRSFDVPLLDTRYRMHAQSFPAPATHIDLLSPARAIWKHRLPNCALGTIERMVLGVTRGLDAPGWMIPQMYFDYLRTRQVGDLAPVFEHNRSDILPLARLTAIVHAYETGRDRPADAIDRLALALHRWRTHGSSVALDDLKIGWGVLTVPATLRLRALREVSVALKRQRRHAEAQDIWQQALSDPSRDIRVYAAEELAKYLEHWAGDHELALAVVRRGADGAALAGDIEAAAAFERRLRRLEQKIRRGRGDRAADEEKTHSP